jgi:hypothetical protein
MKAGLLEKILFRRYGQPIMSIRDGMVAKCWNTDTPSYEAVLYLGMKWESLLGLRFGSLKDIYGDALGGFLMGDSLRAAMLSLRSVYALWNIDEFRGQPEVRNALAMDPGIDYFMDQDMVLFYGIKKGQLFVFDAETDELDSLGFIEPALESVMDELEAARADD